MQPAADEWDITFVLDDRVYPTHTIARIDTVSTLWPLGAVEIRAFACNQVPWVVPQQKTGALDITLFANGSSAQLFATCGGPTPHDGIGMSPGLLSTPTSGDSILIEVQGVLDDMTSFRVYGSVTAP
jgi:hypothetical protein